MHLGARCEVNAKLALLKAYFNGGLPKNLFASVALRLSVRYSIRPLLHQHMHAFTSAR